MFSRRLMVLTLSENRHCFLFNLVLVSVSLYRVSEKCTKIEHSNATEKKQKFRRLYIYIYPNLETHTPVRKKLNLEVERQTLRFLHPRNMASTPLTFYPTNSPSSLSPWEKVTRTQNTFIFLFLSVKIAYEYDSFLMNPISKQLKLCQIH